MFQAVRAMTAVTATATDSTAAPDDEALVQAFRAGDRRAFEQLVRRHQKPVWAVVWRFARDRDDADDLAQRAFITALERIDDLKGRFRPWLLRIAANLAKNHLRDNAKFVREEVEPDAPRSDLDERLDDARRRARMRQAIETLSERQREVVLLRIDGQLSFAEVGEAIGITENNAKVHFHHAMKRLKERLGGSDEGL